MLKFSEHTILQLIGPSCCGKSHFAHLIKEKLGKDCEIVSSDENRRYLLGESLHKHDEVMMYASHHAFALLHNQVDYLSSYPINRKLIIVDSTGLSGSFRAEIKAIAKKNHYNLDCVVFRYKNKDDFYKFVTEDTKRFVIDKHVKKLMDESRHIKSGDYGQRIILKDLDFPTEFVLMSNGVDLSKCFV